MYYLNCRYSICLLSLWLFSWFSEAVNDNRFEHIKLPPSINTRVECILEDEKGVMWFGTNNGLVSFDAYEVRLVEYIDEDDNRASFGAINALVEDGNGQLWIGTANGVFIYDKEKQTSIPIHDQYLDDISCRALYHTSDDEICIGTIAGLYIYNQEGEFLESYLHQPKLNIGLSHHVVRSFYEDHHKRIWVGTFDGLNCLDREQKTLNRYRLQKADSLTNKNNLVLSIQPRYADSDSILLVGTETGLCIFNAHLGTFEQYRHHNTKNSISNNVVKTVCVDGSSIWLGTDLGLNLFDIERMHFENYFHHYKNSYSISNNVINQLYIDRQRNLWLATENGIDKLYLRGSNILHSRFYETASVLAGEYFVTSLSEQPNGDIWMSTGEGLFRYQKERDAYQRFLPPQLLHNKVRDVYVDEKGMVWITTAGGLNLYNGSNKQFYSYVANVEDNQVLQTNYLDCIAHSSSGDVWLGSHNLGVHKVIKGSGDELTFVNFRHHAGDDNSLSSDRINDIVIDANGNAWIATRRGLNKIDVLRGVVERFRLGLENRNQYISKLFIEDENLWIAANRSIYLKGLNSSEFRRILDVSFTINDLAVKDSIIFFTANNALYFFNQKKEEVIRIPKAEIGLNSVLNVTILNDNKIVLSGKEGFVVFKMDEHNLDKSMPDIRWTNFSILHVPVTPFDLIGNRYIIDRHIDEVNRVELKYSENTFKLEFSSLQYSHVESCNYQYILEGYDKEWITTTPGQAFAAYTQVRPGTYKLKVKASNKYGLFGNDARELIIKIAPPLYLSHWAIIIYVLFIVVLFIISRRLLIIREKTNSDIRFQKLQRQKSEELIEIKTRFFTNISHELKTPLTLISSPIDDLLSKEPEEPVKSSLLLVKRNTDRLKKLVNQILDIRKIETGGEKLSIQEYDIIRFCDRVINQFKEEAERRGMLLQYNTDETALMMWFDMEKIEKVLVNLLSNAFKFTPDGGCIRVVVKDGRKQLRKQNEVVITVIDDGCGIKKEVHDQIFDRFNTQASPNYSNQQGTGIGLSLVKEYVTMHGGTIRIESEPDSGSSFVFTIPLNKYKFGHYEEQYDEKSNEDEVVDHELVSSLETDKQDAVQESKMLVLVVEDDHDMREYIVSGMQDQYKVLTAENGIKGLSIAKEEVPDIIISDWMMPHMDGIELCERVKSDLRTCHIPLILLTAKGGLENKTEGIETGADDYIQKPFSMAYLLIRMKNLWQQRERLKMVYQKQHNLEPSEITVTSLDEKFLSDIMELLEKDMDNPELNVKNLSEKMGMSHTNMYRKIKALTGQTATEFIRTIRLKRAAQLLKAGQLNVSEVMYMVGFSHRSYFTQSFKALYGVSPKEYK
jgi:signal transduction histidine kinase/ligand-binding sensor domain-containing protein/DNA-binding response OmpR family regulator